MGVQIQGDTGNVIATKGTYSGNVTIGGTLTYEDVTNIDSVGLITAREGIEVGARPGVAASISVDGNMIVSGITTIGGVINASSDIKVGSGVTVGKDGDIFATGVCTATSFAGDGSALTGIGGTDFIHSEQINNSGIVTAQSFVPTVGQFSHRNIIINGAMQIAQRGSSTSSNATYCVDRFMCLFSGTDESPTFSHVDVSSGTTPYTSGFRKALKITNGNQTGGAGTSDYIAVDVRLEAQDLANSGWNYVSSSSFITYSFWVKSSVAQNFYGYFKTSDGTSQQYPFETGALTADTWTKITKTIPGNSNLQFDNNNEQGLMIRFVAFRGTDKTSSSVTLNAWGAYNSSARMPDNTSTWYTTNDATLEMTGFQLEVGPVATPFEHRSFHDDLQRCFRYYRQFGANNALPTPASYNRFALGYSPTGGSSARFTLQLDPPMRINPLNANLTTNGNFNTQPGSSGGSSAITVDDNSCNVQSMTFFCAGLASVSTGDAISLLADGDTTAYIAINADF